MAERARVLLANQQQIVKGLQDARGQILAQLATQPADRKLWQLGQIQRQLETILTAVGTSAGAVADGALRQAWQQG